MYAYLHLGHDHLHDVHILEIDSFNFLFRLLFNFFQVNNIVLHLS